MEDYRVAVEHDGDPENIGLLGRSISEYNSKQVGFDDQRRVAIYLRDGDDEIVAGVFGSTYWDWLDISLLWVREDLRGQGLGTRLLAAAEREAVERGCKQAQLDTFSFQSPRFYEKHGYEVFGELDGFAGDHRRYYMRKVLAY